MNMFCSSLLLQSMEELVLLGHNRVRTSVFTLGYALLTDEERSMTKVPQR